MTSIASHQGFLNTITPGSLLYAQAQIPRRAAEAAGGWPAQAPEISLAQAAPVQSVATEASPSEVRAHASLAQDVYNDTPNPPPGYRTADAADLAALELDPALLENGDFRARVYTTGSGAETRYIVAFRGSQSAGDWVSNIRQGVGVDSPHYRSALDVARMIGRSDAAGQVTFTGHSLGGGLASAAAIAAGAEAHTFNAAGLHGDTIAAARQVHSANGIAGADSVDAWQVEGEALTRFQEGGDRLIGGVIGGIPGALLADAPEAYGAQHELDAVAPEGKGFFDRISSIDRHGMDWVLSSLPE